VDLHGDSFYGFVLCIVRKVFSEGYQAISGSCQNFSPDYSSGTVVALFCFVALFFVAGQKGSDIEDGRNTIIFQQFQEYDTVL
jgi:hypothetical protein